MKKILILTAFTVSIISCQRGCASLERDFQTSSRTYTVEMYSGGKVVYRDKFTGIVNNSEHSDGIYYYKKDTLIEMSGDYVLKSLR